MAKKQNVKKEEVKPIVTPKKRVTPVKKTTPVIVKKITAIPVTKKVIVPEPVVLPKNYKVKDLLTEIKAWENTVVNLEFKNKSLQTEKNQLIKDVKDLTDNRIYLKKQWDNTTQSFHDLCDKHQILEREKDLLDNEALNRYSQIKDLTHTCNNVIPFLKYYKQSMSTNYGPTTVNIIFSLIMFVVFGVSVLAGFGIKHLVNDGTNVSVIAITTLTSVAIGYFLYLINWKK